MQNVFPESVMIGGIEKIGQIQRVGSKFCMDKLGRALNRQIGIYNCHGHGYSQGFVYQKTRQIVFHHSECLSLAQKENATIPNGTINKLGTFEIKNSLGLNRTLAPVNTTNHVVLLKCNATSGDKWHYDESVRYHFVPTLKFYSHLFSVIFNFILV